MRERLRILWNQLFTGISGLSIVLMGGALVIILAPMIVRGMGAVFFRSTVEFRKMQYREPMFHRGNLAQLEAETAATNEARTFVYDILDKFGHGIDTESQSNRAKHLFREFRKQLSNRNIPEADRERLLEIAKTLRDALLEAYECDDADEAQKALAPVLDPETAAELRGTVGEVFFSDAAEFRDILGSVDLNRRGEYLQEYKTVQGIITRLFGPRPGENAAADLAQFRYGATRWDQTQKLLDELEWKESWVSQEGSDILKKIRTPRRDLFQGTPMEKLFNYVPEQIDAMMLPKLTVYWQYFIDDCTPGHYFGGVGPEIIGTLLLTLLAMVFAVPVGIISAAYLVEYATDNWFIRLIRICINTLAGVPSIVFGLFSLAFFVTHLQPLLGLKPQSSIFAGSLTLAILVLPIIIRASEEAIRAVPRTFKEASLGLGAGRFRTFILVILPAALPGVLTGIILSMSRAAGETAAILFAAAVAFRKGIPSSIFEGGTRTLSYSSYDIAVGDTIAKQVPHNQYGIIMTLILLILLMNLVAIVIRSRVAGKLRGH